MLAIAMVAGGAIGYQVLLMRLYSIVQWHHFAYMIISIALLGFGVSGTFLALARSWLLERFLAVWQISAALFGAIAVAGFALAQRLSFHPLELAWEPRQAAYLSLVYLLLMVPFFCAAICIGLTFARFSGSIGRIYAFDLVGSGLGAAGIIAALFLLMPQNCLRLVLAVGVSAAALAELGRAPVRWGRAAMFCTVAVLGAVVLPGSWIEPRISEYKGLSQALRVPGAEVVYEASSPLGLVTVVESPTIPFRHVPGLSLVPTVEPPKQLGLFTDGDGMTAITRYDGDRERLAYLDFTTQALPYHLLSRPEVLILGVGGGSGVLLADRYHHAARVDGVEVNPDTVRLLRGRFADFAGNILDPAGVRVVIADARSHVAATDRRYDLVDLPMLESFGAAAAGLTGLSETYVYTVEAFRDYLALLRPGGILAVTRWLKLPPRDSLKIFATAVEALERSGVARPSKRLALIRSWNTTTLLVKNGDFASEQIDALRAFARERSFDLAYYPGMLRTEANKYNLLVEPYFYDGAVALLGPERDRFVERYKFDIDPATDDRPYFFDFFKWGSLPELLALRTQGAVALIDWGYLILLATLAQAAVLSAALILLPLRALRREPTAAGHMGAVAAYFLALGLAFLFVEIAFISRLVLFLGHPLYAVAVVLAAFLAFAGLGAAVSPRLAHYARKRGLSAVGLAVGGIVVVAALYLAILPPLLGWLMPLAAPLKVAAALALIAPLALCMGMPFPLGLSRLAERSPALVPWAWGINGCASVISAVLATVLAIGFGFTAVVGLALALYVLAALASRRLA